MDRTKFRGLAAIGAAGVMALGLVACGGGDDASAGGATTMAMTSTAMNGHSPTTADPAADLRVTLDRLFGEHAVLAVITMQKGYDGAKDFDASAAALEANTVDLGAAVRSVYGEDAETAFLAMWREHIGFFVDYTVATAAKDEAGRRKALDDLDGYRQGFANFLAQANPNLKAGDVATLLAGHVRQLTGALDDYAAGDYAGANADLRESYAHMFMTGDALAAAIVAQSPEKFTAPTG